MRYPQYMSDLAQRLLEQALDLPVDERAAVAARLLDSVESPADEGVEAAWAQEIERRARDTLSGERAGVPWDEARSRILDRLRRPS